MKVPAWVDGVEDIEYVGVGARFGLTLESKEKHANKTRLVLADPPDLCRPPKYKVSNCVLLVIKSSILTILMFSYPILITCLLSSHTSNIIVIWTTMSLGSLTEMSFWCTEVIAASQLSQILLKRLMLRLFL